MWPNCSCGGVRCDHRDSAYTNACLETAVTACNYYPLPWNPCTIHFTNSFVAASRVDSSVKVETLPDVPASFLMLQQQPRRRRLCRQQCCAGEAAAAAALRRSLKAQRQRIRRLDESYRAAERARNAQRQRRLRADAEYRERELLRSRLRRQQKNALCRQRAQYCSFEELNWLRECFSGEEWASLQSLWSTPTQDVGWQRDAKEAWTNTTTWAPAIAAGADPVPQTAPRLSFMAPTAIHDMSAARYPPLIVGPEAPGDEPKTRLLLSVPAIALDMASTVTLEDLLTGAIPMRFGPDGRLVPLESNEELAA
ncbi:uncharacterized protein LOC125945193 [Dermacentor silvarum]|uniref:uncharacterized protein LOC125945193 n=1 Tax=Dermacentor silvarum TaxID=543639 RepID=UPI002101C0F9|nr:uncharacterized protein LOC125945193 [Dermacentor silvarum]